MWFTSFLSQNDKPGIENGVCGGQQRDYTQNGFREASHRRTPPHCPKQSWKPIRKGYMDPHLKKVIPYTKAKRFDAAENAGIFPEGIEYTKPEGGLSFG